MDFIRKMAEGSYRAVFGRPETGNGLMPREHEQTQEEPNMAAARNKDDINHAKPNNIVANPANQDIGPSVIQGEHDTDEVVKDPKARTLALLDRALDAKRAMRHSYVSEERQHVIDDPISSLSSHLPEKVRLGAVSGGKEQSSPVIDNATLSGPRSKKRNRPGEFEAEIKDRPSKSRKTDSSEVNKNDQTMLTYSVDASGTAQRGDTRAFADDFGESPARLAVVNDQGSPRKALLLNNELMQKLKDAVQGARHAGQTALEAEDQLWTLADFRRYAESELARAPVRWQALEGVPGQEVEMQRIARESKALEKKLERGQTREHQIRDNLSKSETNERVQLLQAIIAIEDVFVEHGLIDEDHGQARQQHDLSEDFSVPKSDQGVPIGNRQASQRGEVIAKEAAEQMYWQRLDELTHAQRQFEGHQEGRHGAAAAKIAQQDHRAVQVDGSDSDKSTARVELRSFRDREHVQDGMRLTRNVIEAEHHLAAAKAHAVQLGIDIADSELSSGFVDSDRDGADSEIIVPRDLIDQSGIFKWLEGIPEVMDPNNSAKGWITSLSFAHGTNVQPEDVPELDEWDGAAVALKDNTSLVAEGSRRRRIDRVQERSGIDLNEVKRHWGEHNVRGFRSEDWDRAHRLFETGR